MTGARPADADQAMCEPLVAPFAGWVVHPDWAERVISRAYDNLSPLQRQALVASNPYSYMNVTRSREDLFDNTDLSHGDLVTQGASALTRLLNAKAFVPTGRPALYLYRLTHKQGSQTGVVCTVPVPGFSDGRIRIHENVHDERADLLTAHLQGVGATSSPVAMAVRTTAELYSQLFDITAAAPADLEFGSTAVRHQVWTVPDVYTESLVAAFDNQVLYVTDGHHRSAAAVRARATEPNDTALARTLAVVFPDEQLQVQAFHRLAVDQHDRSPEECLTALDDVAEVTPVFSSMQARPQKRGMAGLYLGGSWHQVALPPAVGNGAVNGLDVERLRRSILDPVLGADELGVPGVVEYLPASLGFDEMARRCDAENRVGFALHPMTVRELMAVADENGLMPPKSSFFAPKPRSGVFLRMLGRGATAHLPPS
ncbi:MAG: DUF1015 domain-containing protein [Acidimicrobiia bacterium]|nr:DUF1015 family protein [bacterium]MXW58238.1 DUF1015 domain-containing protein [Acidimicrobiia bacterium]MYB72930.1 DUF1015 domain-containing protein [Acidimicrobiia bacterium]MYH99004.1 DUF1015 domain-containing protein [Acidimicrobiia bacterium]